MGKYEPLTHYLNNQSSEIWDARFADVEQVLGFALPRSAHDHPAWWANQKPGHSQTLGWSNAGWETCGIDLATKHVKFRKRGRTLVAVNKNESRDNSLADLWDQAEKLSGIEDRDNLLRAALTALIRREAAKGLIAMGGTMPDFVAPPRERPTW